MKTLSRVVTIAAVAATTLLSTFAQARIDKQDRVLIVVSELQRFGPQNLRDLYRVTEDLTVNSTNFILGDDYRFIVTLKNQRATLNNFKAYLRSYSKDPSIKAIDVIFSLHGSNERVYFYEGGVDMATLQRELTAVNASMTQAQVNTMKRKLRMVYNLSCFGRSHLNEFIGMGFDVAVGSQGVNANSESEFVPVLGLWSIDWQFQDTFNASNNDVALALADGAARIVGVIPNSRKFFQGRTQLKISTDPL